MKRIMAVVAATIPLVAGLALPSAAVATEVYSAYFTYASAPDEILGKTTWGIQKLTAEEAATVPVSAITVRSSQFLRSSSNNLLYKVVFETVTQITELTWRYEGYPTPRQVDQPPAHEYYTYASHPTEIIVKTPLGAWRQAKATEYGSVPTDSIINRVDTYYLRQPGQAQVYKRIGEVTEPITDAQWRGEGSPTPMVVQNAPIGYNVFENHGPYRDPAYPSVAAAKALRAEGRIADASEIDKISAYAGSLWIGEWDSGDTTTNVVRNYAQRAIDTGQTGVLVVYAIPGRACTGHSAGGHTFDAYKPWIDEVAAGIEGRRLAVIVEPDALLQLGRCPELEGDRIGYLQYAVKALGDAGGTVYLDAASSNFLEGPAVMADRLRLAGVESIRGFAVNVANHKTVDESRKYADEVSRLLGGHKYVIDTSRNGNGSNGGEWCNSRGRALGPRPEAVTHGNQDANLWIKTVGASDGTCNGGPPDGLWWNEIAIEMATNSIIPGTSTSPTAMISEWNVGSAGCSTITVPLHGDLNATIDWGDGTVEPVTSAMPTHTYADSAGHRTVTVDGTFTEWGGESGWTPACLTQVTRWAATGTTSIAYGLAGATALTDVAQLTPTITDMSYLFRGNTTFDREVAGWDLSRVTNLSHMFDGATAFNRPVAAWNTANVTDMSGMFAGATSFNRPVGAWNTSSVTDFSSMFRGATAFRQAVGTWDTSAATSFASMFDGATKFNQPVKTWNTAAATDMSRMFRNTPAFNQNLSTWDTSRVTTMASMLDGAASFNQPLSTFSVVKVTDMSRMFAGARVFNQGIGGWNTGRVTTMKEMFRDASAFNRSLASWNVNAVTDYADFRTGSALSSYNLPKFHTATLGP
ncbi:MAG TPA: BspA family leucine-rich repeat surface protein [Glaciibacter sp.]|nr:BspA family leucine-rich repeat surface protein [Glaciibacter sp.]